MNLIFRKNNFIYFLLLLLIFLGFSIITDYGIGIEEHFQRKSGFFWLNYLLSFTEFNFLKTTVEEKFTEINNFTPNLFPIEKVPYYGIVFDLPLAFFETIFKINNPLNYFLLRHKAIFLIFLLSAFLFYKIIFLRFKNIYLSIFGFLIFIFSPRIFGNIFFDNKDILFLSILTINFYFFFRYFQNSSAKNFILLTFICAISTSTRIIGIFLPFSFLILILFEYLADINHKKFIKKLTLFLMFYILFLFLHWPYLWSLSLSEWLNFFVPFFQAMNPTVYFNGDFYQSKHLPIYYLPYWIVLTTPIYLQFLFLFGFIYNLKRFFIRYSSIKTLNKNFRYDLWRTNSEKFDVIIFINLFLIIMLLISIKLALLSGWRHFYFVNFFIIYYSCFAINIIILKYRKKIIIKNILILFFLFLLLQQLYENYKFHPFQSVYFNNTVSDNKKLKFEIDTQSLSRTHAIKEILKKNNSDLINIGTASWTPLEDARSMIPVNMWKKLNFVGTNFQDADYIYSNHYYEINHKINKKYKIPKNYSIYKTLIIDGTRIYTIYKKE